MTQQVNFAEKIKISILNLLRKLISYEKDDDGRYFQFGLPYSYPLTSKTQEILVKVIILK